jgi:hypothetical protein
VKDISYAERTMDESTPIPPLLRLPAELILHILSFVDPLDLARGVALSHKALKGPSYDDRIWQPIVNDNLIDNISSPRPCKTFRELYVAHHPYWFLPRHQIWFGDTGPTGKLIISRFDPQDGTIVAYAVTASRGPHSLLFWEKDPNVIIHSFDPDVKLDMSRPILRLSTDGVRTDDQPGSYPSDRGYSAPSRYSKEALMEMFAEPGLYSSFILCRKLPSTAISEGTEVWPPLRFPAHARVRNSSQSNYNSSGHRPSSLNEMSEHNFRLRKWVEYNGRRSSPRMMSFSSPNGLAAALGLSTNYFTASMATNGGGGISIRMPEDISTFATLPKSCYTPTAEKPWQGIWCGDYSGHGCEFILIRQPDREDELPLPEGMAPLQAYFRGEQLNGDNARVDEPFSESEHGPGDENAEHQWTHPETDQQLQNESSLVYPAGVYVQPSPPATTDYTDVPRGRLEAVKLTGDINIPRGQYTFIAPELGHEGFVRVADEEVFRGARVVRSAGHIAARGFVDGE